MGVWTCKVHTFLIYTWSGGVWSTLCPSCFKPHTHSIAGWVESRAKLDAYRKGNLLTLLRFEVLAEVLLKIQPSAMWYCVIVRVVPNILKDHSAFIFTFKQSKNMQCITIVQGVKNYPPNEAVSVPEDLWLEAFIAWQCQCIQNVTVGTVPLELWCVSRGTILLKIRDWQMRSC